MSPEGRHIPFVCALVIVALPSGAHHLLGALDKLWPKRSPSHVFDESV